MRNPVELLPPRYFAGSADGVEILSVRGMESLMGISPDLSLAYDVMTDNGIKPTEKHLELLVACERKGDDPVAFARHLSKLIKAANS